MTKEELLNELKSGGYLKTPIIIKAFQKIDRKDFVPREYQVSAYGNYPLPIGFDQTISQPLTVAFMLELLQPRPGEKILDIGAGSGWVTALLTEIVSRQGNQRPKTKDQKSGRVIGIERISALAEMAEENIKKFNFIEMRMAKIICGDGSKGYLKEAPYDKIIAAATAEKIPTAWQEQLKIGGRLVAPLNHNIVVLDKISKNNFQKKEYFGFSFVPLIQD